MLMLRNAYGTNAPIRLLCFIRACARARARRSRSIFRRRLSRAVTSGDVIVREGALPLRNAIAHKGAPCPETGPPALRNEERDAEIGRAGEKKGLRQQTRATRHVDGVFRTRGRKYS